MSHCMDEAQMDQERRPGPMLALEFIEVGRNEDGEPVVLLTGSEEAVRAAGKLYGQAVVLLPADQAGAAA